MGRTLASFPWPVYDSIRSWCSQVCVCVSPRFVSAPGHAGHTPPSLFPPPHSHSHLPFPAHRWEERGREREKQPFHPGFEVHEGRRSLGRTSRHTPRFQTHCERREEVENRRTATEADTRRGVQLHPHGSMVDVIVPPPPATWHRGEIFGSRRGMHATDV